MRDKKQPILIGIFVTILVAAIGFFVYSDITKSNVADKHKTTDGIEYSGDGNLKVERIDVDVKGEPTLPPPDLSKPIVYPDYFNAEARAIMQEKFDPVIAELERNINQFNALMSYGQMRKTIDDYEEARYVWEYAKELRPNRHVTYGNLATLYGYYLEDPIKAEQNFKDGIGVAPGESYLYVSAAEFYRDYKQTDKAIAILQEGLTRIPGDQSMQELLEQLMQG